VAERRERGGLVWPVLLIIIGGTILANNLGLVSVDVWSSLLRLWPAILMAIGIELLVPRRTVWGTLVALVLIIGVFALAYLGLTGVRIPAGTTQSIRAERGAATSAEVMLRGGVGEIRAGAGATEGALVEGMVVPLTGERIESQRSAIGDEVQVRVASERSGAGPIFLPSTRGRWDLSLSGDLPMAIDASLGVGLIGLDLVEVEARSLVAEVGVGKLEVRLPAGVDIDASLSTGIGETVVWLPSGARAEIRIDRGIAGLSLPAGAEGQEDMYFVGPTGPDAIHIRLGIDHSIGAVYVRQR
jgi:hypothetical protein